MIRKPVTLRKPFSEKACSNVAQSTIAQSHHVFPTYSPKSLSELLESEKIHCVAAGNLISRFIGHSAMKTKKVLQGATDGAILFISDAERLLAGDGPAALHEILDVCAATLTGRRTIIFCVHKDSRKSLTDAIGNRPGLEMIVAKEELLRKPSKGKPIPP